MLTYQISIMSTSQQANHLPTSDTSTHTTKHPNQPTSKPIYIPTNQQTNQSNDLITNLTIKKQTNQLLVLTEQLNIYPDN